jgi:hypothetical protein
MKEGKTIYKCRNTEAFQEWIYVLDMFQMDQFDYDWQQQKLPTWGHVE